MNILAIGDVVGAGGCDFLRAHLPSFKKLNQIDVCIVNGENAAPGNGITPAAAQDLFTSGADLITTGNHVYRRREVYTYLDETEYLIRPANYRAGSPGRGYQIIDKGRVQIAVINLLGVVFLDPLENPFDCVDRLLRQEELKAAGSKLWIFTRKPRRKSERSAFIWTVAFLPCSARTRMCRRPTSKFCRKAQGI